MADIRAYRRTFRPDVHADMLANSDHPRSIRERTAFTCQLYRKAYAMYVLVPGKVLPRPTLRRDAAHGAARWDDLLTKGPVGNALVADPRELAAAMFV